MFYFSRTIIELFTPFHFSFLLLVVCLFFLFLRRHRAALICLSCALSVLIICGYGLISRQEVEDREKAYAPMTESQLEKLQTHPIRYVVVLGSSHVSDGRLPTTSQIGGSSLFRLVEGIRLFRHFPEAKLVISGGIGYDPVPNAEIVGKVANELGIPDGKMIIENRPRDTMEEAERLHPLLGDAEFILVTSALHMHRAVSIFRNQGMHPVPAPTDYLIKRDTVKPAGDLFPSSGNLELSGRILYELIGEQWMKIKGYTKRNPM
jgi:uncharacterized SAM-binding protein YcdF (DUF218 family)